MVGTRKRKTKNVILSKAKNLANEVNVIASGGWQPQAQLVDGLLPVMQSATFNYNWDYITNTQLKKVRY